MGEYDFIAASFIIAVWGDCFNLYKLKLSVCRSEKASPSPIADATSEGLMLSGFVRRAEEVYLASSLGWMKNFSMPMNVPWVIWRELERTKP